MHNSKSALHRKIIVWILSIATILSTFSGCALSDKMRADMGFVDNRDVYYQHTLYPDTNTLVCINPENDDCQEYHYEDSVFIPDNIDASLLDECYQEAEGIFLNCISTNFAIVVYKLDLMHFNRLHKHIADQLIYLNPNSKNLEVVYQADKYEKIIYGTLDYVLVYLAEYNVYRCISLRDNSVIYEVESNIDPYSGDYGFYIYEKKQIVEVLKFISITGEMRVIDSLTLE